MAERKRLPIWVWVVLALDAMLVFGFLLGPGDTLARLHCPSGQLEVQARDYSYKPGQQGTEYITFCLEGASRHEIGGRVAVTAGALLAAVIAGPVIAVLIATRKRKTKIQPRQPWPPARDR